VGGEPPPVDRTPENQEELVEGVSHGKTKAPALQP
jgi:hypothetical protein